MNTISNSGSPSGPTVLFPLSIQSDVRLLIHIDGKQADKHTMNSLAAEAVRSDECVTRQEPR